MSDTAGAVTPAPPMAATYRPVTIPALTGLRAIAAGVVVAHHLRALIDVIAPYPISSITHPLLINGMLGVDVFFILSGFIIAHTYAHRLTEAAPGSFRAYLHARVARVYPLHLVTFLVFCIILFAGFLTGKQDFTGQEHTPLGFVGNVLMFQGVPGVVAWNFPSWSLTCEFAAYLLFPLFAAWVLRVRWRAALVVATLVLCLQLATMFHFGAGDPGTVALGWPRIAGEFTAGVMGWVVWRRVLRPGRWADVVTVLCTVGVWWLLLSGYSWLWTIPLFAVMIPAIASSTGPVGKALAHPIAQWSGRVSFAVYLVHGLVSTAAIMWIIPADMYVHHSTKKSILVIAGMFVASWAFGALFHHGVEEPARRWMNRRFAARVAARVTQPCTAPVRGRRNERRASDLGSARAGRTSSG